MMIVNTKRDVQVLQIAIGNNYNDDHDHDDHDDDDDDDNHDDGLTDCFVL